MENILENIKKHLETKKITRDVYGKETEIEDYVHPTTLELKPRLASEKIGEYKRKNNIRVTNDLIQEAIKSEVADHFKDQWKKVIINGLVNNFDEKKLELKGIKMESIGSNLSKDITIKLLDCQIKHVGTGMRTGTIEIWSKNQVIQWCGSSMRGGKIIIKHGKVWNCAGDMEKGLIEIEDSKIDKLGEGMKNGKITVKNSKINNSLGEKMTGGEIILENCSLGRPSLYSAQHSMNGIIELRNCRKHGLFAGKEVINLKISKGKTSGF